MDELIIKKFVFVKFVIKITDLNSVVENRELEGIVWDYPFLPRIGDYVSARMLSKWYDAEKILGALEEDWKTYRDIYTKELMYTENLNKANASCMALKKCLDTNLMKVTCVKWLSVDFSDILVELVYIKNPF